MDKLPTVRVVYDRKKEATDSKPALIYIEISHNRVRKYISTGVSIYPNQWVEGACSIRKHNNAIKLNLYLESFRRKVMDDILEASKHPLGFDINDFSSSIKRERKSLKISFIDFMYERLDKRGLREGTKRQHLVAIRALERSGIIVGFRDLTPDRLARFNDYLVTDLRLKSQQTISSYHRRIATYISEAITLGYIDSNPYTRYKVERGKTTKIKYLNKEEVEQIRYTALVDDVLVRVRDLFVLQIYTGLSYADMYATDYKGAEFRNGHYYIRDNRVKTNEEYFLMLLEPALSVLQKYDWDLPKYSNQKYNMYLKALGVSCGIKKPLTSHMARHTFATTITLSNNVPIQIVAKMLGHSDIKTTQRYAKVLAEDVNNSFLMLEDKLLSRP